MTTILTLALDSASQAQFQALRQQHYPPALNRIPAHVSLFHALLGDASTREVLREAAAAQPRFPVLVESVRSMGRGVMYMLAAEPLMRVHGMLAGQFRTFLTPQDRQPLRPHVVVQNKVEAAEAKALLAALAAGFTPWSARAEGLDWWEYLGGEWRFLEHLPFISES